MKATVEITDAIFEKAKKLAKKRKTSMRSLIEEGLILVFKSKEKSSFKLKDASVKGKGLTERFKDASWEKLRNAAYGERE